MTSDEERPFKETLYQLMEKVRATKAAFYLSEPNGSYALAASYGFGRTDRFATVIHRGDAMAQAVNEARVPRYANDFKSAGALANLMDAASSTRILTAPLYLDGRMIGILDVRDKAGREPFLPADIERVNEILERLSVHAAALPRYRSVGVEEEEFQLERGFRDSRSSGNAPPAPPPAVAPGPAPRAEAPPRPAPAAPQSLDELPVSHLPSGAARLLKLVEETLARTPAPRPAIPASVRARETAFHRLHLEACLHLPDLELAAITLCGRREVEIVFAARRPISADVEPAVLENVEKVFARSGAGFPLAPTRRLTSLRAPAEGASPLGRGEFAAIQSSVLQVSSDEVSILSFVFRHGPGADTREGLKDVHLLIKTSLEEVRGAGLYREAYKNLVNKLLEPGLKKYAALKTHSFNVGRMARKIASALRLPAIEIEQITVAAILHDIGMKDLSYDELYAKRNLNEEELRLLREHARVGAYLLDEVPWPYPVAPLVKHHHERWDGAGYPDGLRGEQIPLGSRIIHLCEAFDAMTSPTSYRAVISAGQALEILSSKGGTQFDPELLPAFRAMVETMKPAQ
ncbi:MAG: HD domain-containing phosphohydrolase [Thermoanaerobaculia bacterium]